MKVEILDLTFDTIIGILPFERKTPQKVIINLSFKYSFKDGEFIDYSLVAKDIQKLMQKNKYKLIEDALLDIKKELKKSYKIKKLKLSIKKPTILDNCVVGVSI